MSHPNVDLALELQKCVAASDTSSVEMVAVAGKRKGYLLLDPNLGRYVLTRKGEEFNAKWGKPRTGTAQVKV